SPILQKLLLALMFLRKKFLVFKTVNLHYDPIIVPLSLFNVYIVIEFTQRHLMHLKEYNEIKRVNSKILIIKSNKWTRVESMWNFTLIQSKRSGKG
ncbi:MAG: hypothetical protein WBL64_02335, partial [Nitrososphaeraceae archaeon]